MMTTKINKVMQQFRIDMKDEDVRDGYYYFFIGIVLFILNLILSLKEKEFNLLSYSMLFFFSALILSGIKQRKLYLKSLKKSDLHGITRFNPSRDLMPKLYKILEKAEKTIDIYAIKHQKIREPKILNLLTEKARNGCEIRLLFMEAYNNDSNINDLKAVREYSEEIDRDMRTNTQKALNWKDRLNRSEPDVSKSIQIKAYSGSPSCTFVLCDRDELETGFVQLEVFLPYVSKDEQPHYQTKKTFDKIFFDQHVDIFEFLWNEAHEINRDNYPIRERQENIKK